ncbi:MAG: PQQ-binding-like beta-propeller repeat protein [Deltaproteobacteria bacterium]|nr:PQQ-binding-like beta-propeller repeat protein [Deltaproteobacteria bacterium]
MLQGYSKKLFTKSALIILSLCLSSCSQVITIKEGPSWSTYLGDNKRTNKSTVIFQKAPTIRSEYNLAPFFNAPEEINATPIIEKGVLYTSLGTNKFSATKISTGEKLWSFKARSVINGAPTLSEKIVLVGSSRGVLYCLEKKTGKELWSFQTLSEVISAPLIAEKNIYVASTDGRIYDLQKKTGKKIWSYKNSSLKTSLLKSNSSLLLSGDSLYYVFSDGTLLSLNVKSGAREWKNQILKRPIDTNHRRRTPVLDSEAELLYLIDDAGFLKSFEAASGKEVRTFSKPNSIIDFSLLGDKLIIATSEKLYLVNKKTGKELWSSIINKDEKATIKVSSLLVSDKDAVVFINREDKIKGMDIFTKFKGEVHAFNIKDGSLAWSLKIDEPFLGRAVTHGGVLSFITSKGKLNILAP